MRPPRDVTDEELFEALLQRIRSGDYVGGILGTPCENRSRARLMPNGPPPLADREHLRGLPNLRGRLRAQWEQGPGQLVRSLLVIAELHAAGGMVSPGKPRRPLR